MEGLTMSELLKMGKGDIFYFANPYSTGVKIEEVKIFKEWFLVEDLSCLNGVPILGYLDGKGYYHEKSMTVLCSGSRKCFIHKLDAMKYIKHYSLDPEIVKDVQAFSNNLLR